MNSSHTRGRFVLPLAAAAALMACNAASAALISINFANDDTDAVFVDNDESATALQTGANWNNISVRTDGVAGTWSTTFSNRSVVDDSGVAAGTITANNLPVGDGFTQASGISGAAFTENNGTAGLFASYINFGGNNSPDETLTISGLGSAFTTPGYQVYLYFDIGSQLRTYGFTVNGTTFWTDDNNGDSDANDDGVIDGFIQATGTTSGTATLNANYMVFTGLTGSSFNIAGVGANRAILSGMQIVAIPEPSAALLGGLGLLALLRRRRA